MNFLKNSFNKIFGNEEKKEKKEQKEQKEQKVVNNDQIDVEEDFLRSIFELTSDLLSRSKVPTSDETKLQIYSFYKQATIGDCNIEKPALFQFVKKSKWESWKSLKGMSKSNAMKNYINLSTKIDSNIPIMIKQYLGEEEDKQIEMHQGQKINVENVGLKPVAQQDYSDSYSHPYFKLIEKDKDINDIDHQLLMQINNNPKVYPLHFAIDKQRVDLVQKFVDMLTLEEIISMKDQEGTSIKQYAELIENQQIIDIINKKLKGQQS